jgi:hypothetical protein
MKQFLGGSNATFQKYSQYALQGQAICQTTRTTSFRAFQIIMPVHSSSLPGVSCSLYIFFLISLPFLIRFLRINDILISINPPDPLNQGELAMGDRGSKDKGKKEERKKAKLNPKEKRKLKNEKKNPTTYNGIPR